MTSFCMKKPDSKPTHAVVEYRTICRLIMFTKWCLFYSVSRQFDLKLITLGSNFPPVICVLIYK